MNYMLPIPLLLLLTRLPADVLPGPSSQPVGNKEVVAGREVLPAEPDAANGPQAVSGQELVAQAAQRLLLLPGLEATTRQKVNIFGQRLVGSGTYLQMTSGPRLMLRLDMKLQGTVQSTSVQQISDGNSYWVRRTQGNETTLTRVDLRRLRSAAAKIGPSDVPPPPTLWMALGGLPKLLSALEAHFDFGVPKATMVEDLPLWNLEGRWKPAILANLLPDQREAILAGEPADLSKLPAHLPHGVTLILGRDQVIPLFPYRISYYRLETPTGETAGPAVRQEMVTWDLFKVRFRSDLDASLFDYRPSDNQEVDERTDEYISRLRAATGK